MPVIRISLCGSWAGTSTRDHSGRKGELSEQTEGSRNDHGVISEDGVGRDGVRRLGWGQIEL